MLQFQQIQLIKRMSKLDQCANASVVTTEC